MKTQATKTVTTTIDDSHEDEPDHMLSNWLNKSSNAGEPDPDTLMILSSVCEEVFEVDKPTTHASHEELEREVIRIFGAWLNHYKNRTRLIAIVRNVLIEAKNKIKDETHLGVM